MRFNLMHLGNTPGVLRPRNKTRRISLKTSSGKEPVLFAGLNLQYHGLIPFGQKCKKLVAVSIKLFKKCLAANIL